MTKVGSMGRRIGRKRTGREIGTTLYGELEQGLDRQWPDLKPIVKRPHQRITGPAHMIDAIMAYLLTRTREEQAAILEEGCRITTELEFLEAPGPPVMPGSYRAGPPPKGKGRGNPGHGEIRPGQSAVIDLTRPGREPGRECRAGERVEKRQRRTARGVR